MDFLPLALAGAMIVFMIMSSNKRKRQAAEMTTKVLPGAKVMLTSGIYGDVVSVDDDRVTIKSAGSTSLEVAKGAVARVIEAAPENKSSSTKKPAAKTAATKK
jgi:preprotein translocase subunit YajC